MAITENLTDREKRILANLINYYIGSGDPVGSRVIANKFKMGLSSATIRNTLQDLEELGLVEQPHTSAGRIPTDLGYRFYVDSLLRPEQLTDKEKLVIRQGILRDGRGVKEILGQTARLLGEITRQLGLTLAPKFEVGVLKDLRLIPVTEGRLMIVVIVKSGLARTLIIEVETVISDRAVREVEDILNEKLRGLTLSEIRDTISHRLADVSGNPRLLKIVIDSRDKIWSEDHSDDLLVFGTDNLLRQPEFADQQQMSSILRVLEDGRVLSEFLSHVYEEDLVITIGRENKIDEIVNCSLVTASYRMGKISGVVGIIGPTRMSYNKAISIIEYTARSITDLLSGMSKEGTC